LGYGALSSQVHKKFFYENNFHVDVFAENYRSEICLNIEAIHNYSSFDDKVEKYDIVLIFWRTLNVEKENLLLKLVGNLHASSSVIYFGSAAVYGSGIDFSEDFNAALPINQYGRDKLEIEKKITELIPSNTILFRITNLYGNYGFDDITNRTIRNLYLGQELEIYGDGNETRDYISVSDLMKILAMVFSKDFSRDFYSSCRILNIGTGIGTSTNDLISRISMFMVGEAPKVKYIPNVSQLISQNTINPQKLVKCFNFIPLELNDCLEIYIRNFIVDVIS